MIPEHYHVITSKDAYKIKDSKIKQYFISEDFLDYGNETKMPIRFLTIGNSYGQGLEYIKGAGPKTLERSQSLEEKNPFREGENQNKYCMAFAKLVNELVPRTREEQSKDEQKQEDQER